MGRKRISSICEEKKNPEKSTGPIPCISWLQVPLNEDENALDWEAYYREKYFNDEFQPLLLNQQYPQEHDRAASSNAAEAYTSSDSSSKKKLSGIKSSLGKKLVENNDVPQKRLYHKESWLYSNLASCVPTMNDLRLLYCSIVFLWFAIIFLISFTMVAAQYQFLIKGRILGAEYSVNATHATGERATFYSNICRLLGHKWWLWFLPVTQWNNMHPVGW